MVGKEDFNPTLNWFQLGEVDEGEGDNYDVFYKREVRYDLLWQQVELLDYMIAVGEGSGLIALTRDITKLIVSKNETGSNTINIYSSSGKFINMIKWDKGQLVALNFNSKDQLVCVFKEGLVRIYNLFGSYTQFSIGLDKGRTVRQAKLYPAGLVVLTDEFEFYAVENLLEPRPKHLSSFKVKDTVYSWDILRPSLAPSQHIEVFCATGSLLILVDTKASTDQQIAGGPFKHVQVSPSGLYLALLAVNGQLIVTTTDFTKKWKPFQIEPNQVTKVVQVAWSSDDLVLLHSEDDLIMVGPNGSSDSSFMYEGRVFIASEVDGARILTNSTCEFIQKVSEDTVAVFGIGSTSPAALLYDALDHFQRRNPKADDNVRAIGSNSRLQSAVDTCIRAAGLEFDPSLQANLLKAASFGKGFLDDYDATPFTRMCQSLRVLNGLRNYEVGFPITITQWHKLGIDRIIDRLLATHQHFLAIKIGTYLNLNVDKVVVDWACSKIRASADDEATTSRIVLDKLADRPGLSYHHIAKVASQYGQLQLAIQLLDREPSASAQVPMLLDMGEDERALDKATISGDPNLVYLVLTDLQSKLGLGDFLKLVDKFDQAGDLLELYAKHQNPQLLRDFYYQSDRRLELANLELNSALISDDLDSFKASWTEASKVLTTVKNKMQFSQLANEQIKLIEYQNQLKSKLSNSILGATLADTIKLATRIGEHNLALKLKSEFKVSDQRFWWLKVKGYVLAKDWDGLESFAKSKKSPIGYLPFYNQCKDAQNFSQATKYALRCALDKRPDLLLQIENFKEAGLQAFQLKDVAKLQEIKLLCPDNNIKRELDVLILQLTSK